MANGPIAEQQLQLIHPFRSDLFPTTLHSFPPLISFHLISPHKTTFHHHNTTTSSSSPQHTNNFYFLFKNENFPTFSLHTNFIEKHKKMDISGGSIGKTEEGRVHCWMHGQCDGKRGGEIRVFPAGAGNIYGFEGGERECGVVGYEGWQELWGSCFGDKGWEQDSCNVL